VSTLTLNQTTISLLWPADRDETRSADSVHWVGAASDDIGLNELAGALCSDPLHMAHVEEILRQL
jgi:hypothetical protein